LASRAGRWRINSKVQSEAQGELPHLRWRAVNDAELADEVKVESGN
jgi:hypothetical protein